MVDSYKILYKGGSGELVEKKSRFIADLRPVASEEEALEYIEEIRKKYWKKTVQTISYLPHFISLVVLCGMVKELLASNGPINQLISSLGG